MKCVYSITKFKSIYILKGCLLIYETLRCSYFSKVKDILAFYWLYEQFALLLFGTYILTFIYFRIKEAGIYNLRIQII